ncbi:MAG: hypothetical protein R3C14_17845 [Caldilineaceae bacterium]
MEITVTIPPSVEDHLKTYAASLFYETSPYAISRAIVCALINQLDAACLVSRDEIVTDILESSKAQVVQPTVAPAAKQEPPAITAPSAAPTEKSNGTPPGTLITDPKKLKVPSERFQGNASNTWLVWGWCMASSLNLVTAESGARKFHSFNLQDVIQGVMQRKKVRVKDTTAYSALDVLVKRQWLAFNSTTKLYALSPLAQKWVFTPKNQSYLIEKGFLDPVMHPEPIA